MGPRGKLSDMLVMEESKALPHITFQRFVGSPTNDEVKAYLDAERAKIAREKPKPSVIVFDLGEVWSSTQRRMVKEFQAEVEDVTREAALGLVMMVPNAIIRGAFTAFHWLAPPKYPTAMVPTIDDAYPHVVNWLAAVNLPAPDRSAFLREAHVKWPGWRAVPGKGMVPQSATEMTAHL